MITLAVAVEDSIGEWVVQRVTDAHLLTVGWIEAETIQHHRRWLAFEGQGWLPFRRVGAPCRQRFGSNFRLSGGFDGKPGAADALLLRKLFTLLQDEQERPDIVVVARDVDGTDRRTGFFQALAESGERAWSFAIVPALAQPEVEAWLVSTWCPETDDEKVRLADLRHGLGFDPVVGSHQLTSTSDSKRDAKRVLAELTRTGRGPRDRFAATTLDAMCVVGANNGLAEFVLAHRAALLPSLGLHRPPA